MRKIKLIVIVIVIVIIKENKTNSNSNNRIEILTSNIPLLTAAIEASIRKKYSGGIGGRTIYSVGATKSTLPLVMFLYLLLEVGC